MALDATHHLLSPVNGICVTEILSMPTGCQRHNLAVSEDMTIHPNTHNERVWANEQGDGEKLVP